MTNIMLTDRQVSLILDGNPNYKVWTELLNDMLPKYKINENKFRLAAFFAQTCIESRNFAVIEENLNYSAKRLNVVFPKYFSKAGRDANNFANKPEQIANVVYSGRMGNGDEQSGEGWKFRGRGLIQLTGKYNYSLFANAIAVNINQVVTYLSTQKGALESACWFWNHTNLNDLADNQQIDSISKRVNGGTHAIKERKEKFNEVLKILSETANDQILPSKRGEVGEHIKLVQRLLNVPDDGVFGPTTLGAVKKFQIKNSIPITGIIDEDTISKLVSLLK